MKQIVNLFVRLSRIASKPLFGFGTLAAFCLLGVFIPSAKAYPGMLATIDTNLSTAVTDMTTYWSSIEALVLVVVLFGIGIAFAKRLKTR